MVLGIVIVIVIVMVLVIVIVIVVVLGIVISIVIVRAEVVGKGILIRIEMKIGAPKTVVWVCLLL